MTLYLPAAIAAAAAVFATVPSFRRQFWNELPIHQSKTVSNYSNQCKPVL